MKQMLKKSILLLIVALFLNVFFNTVIYATNTEGEDKEAQETEESSSYKYADFSKATFEWKNMSTIQVALEVKNIINPNKDSRYYAVVKGKNEKDDINDYLKDGIVNISLDNGYFSDLDKNNALKFVLMERDIELNQDMYLTIIESPVDITKNKPQIVLNTKKLKEYEYPKYADLFYSSVMATYNSTLIPLAIPTVHNSERKATMKIGRVSDTNILNKIKNNDENGWTELLKYAKSSSAIWSEKVTLKSGTYDVNKGVLDKSKLVNGAYYYLYTQLDDENGKYDSVEGVTIAKADIPENWFLFFLGQDSFNWDGLSNKKETEKKETNTGSKDSNKTTTKKDDTPSKLPYTGTQSFLIVLIIISTVGIIFFKYKNNQYKGIK